MVAGIAASIAVVAVGTLVAAAAETAFLRASVALAPDGRREPILFGTTLAPAGSGRGTTRVAALRLVLLVPVAAAVAAALPAWIEVAYRELTLPTDLVTPLAVRVLAGAPAAGGLVIVAWLAAEVVGAFAARRAVLLDTGWPRALGRGLVDPVRAPVGTLLTTSPRWPSGSPPSSRPCGCWPGPGSWRRTPLVDEGISPAAAGGTVVLATAWAGVLLLASVAAAWRGCLATAELLRRRRQSGSDATPA